MKNYPSSSGTLASGLSALATAEIPDLAHTSSPSRTVIWPRLPNLSGFESPSGCTWPSHQVAIIY